MASRIVGGYKAQKAGAQAESAVAVSMQQYELNGVAVGDRNYPQIKVLGRGPRGVITKIVGKAGSDWTVSLRGGQTIYLEAKSWQEIDTHFYSFEGNKRHDRQRAQYDWMIRHLDYAVGVFYLVEWRGANEWRLYPVAGLELVDVNRGIHFVRRDGLLVSQELGWPDWLNARG